MHKPCGLWVLVVMVFVLAACGGSKSQPDKDTADDDKWSAKNVKREDTSNRNSGSGNSGGNTAGTGGGNTAKEPEPEPQPEVPESVARTNIEGKVTEFSNVIALWDEVNHSVRFVACTQAIPDDQLARLRNGEPIEGGEVPHIIFSFVLEEGTTTLNKAKVENWFYDFHWLTSLSPASLRNIGKETISVLNGKAKVGETLKLVIKFESAKVKDAPAEQFDFEVNFEVVLQ